MKRLISSRFALLAAVGLACSACNLFEVEDRPYGSAWRVENATARTLLFTPSPYGSAAAAAHTLAPGETVELYSRSEFDDAPYFEMLMILWRGRHEGEIAFELRAADGNLLTRWLYKENEGNYYRPERSFFNERSWEQTSPSEKSRTMRCEWTYRITEGDLLPQRER